MAALGGTTMNSQRPGSRKVRQEKPGSRSLAHITDELNSLLRGWAGYFRIGLGITLAKTLDHWIRRRFLGLEYGSILWFGLHFLLSDPESYAFGSKCVSFLQQVLVVLVHGSLNGCVKLLKSGKERCIPRAQGIQGF
jgi:hypothetical protein